MTINYRAGLCGLVLAVAASPALAADFPPGMVVRQGTATLTFDDIDAFAARVPADQRGGYFNSSKRLDSTLRGMLVDRQVADDARKLGLDKDPQVQRQLQLAMDTALAAVRMRVLREGFDAPDMTELAQERYLSDRSKFVQKGSLDVRHVLVMTDKRTDAEAKAIAEQVRGKALANPGQFEALVEEFSEDPSKTANKGLMASAGSKETYVPEFADAASKLTAVNQVSPVIKTKFGYHVLILVKRSEDHPLSFAEVKDDLVSELKKDYIEKQATAYLSQMQSNELESNPEAVASLRTRYGNVGPQMLDKGGVEKKSASDGTSASRQ